MKRLIRIWLACVLLLVALPFVWLFTVSVPLLAVSNPGRTALMMARGGEVAQDWRPLSGISKHLPRAVVAAEDARFYEHAGVDWAEARQAWEDGRDGGRLRGASTITMQLAKNLYLTPRRSFARKGLETALALWLEVWLTKPRLLELYLNVVEFGDGVYGAEAASRRYFNKSAAALTANEAAFLAAILPNPRRWGRYPPGPGVQRRVRTILARMPAVRATLCPRTIFACS